MNLPPTFFQIINPDHVRHYHLEPLRHLDQLRYLQLVAIALECDAGGRLIDDDGAPLTLRHLAARLATKTYTLSYTLRQLVAHGLLTERSGLYTLTGCADTQPPNPLIS